MDFITQKVITRPELRTETFEIRNETNIEKFKFNISLESSFQNRLASYFHPTA